jgi:hypothetical protein
VPLADIRAAAHSVLDEKTLTEASPAPDTQLAREETEAVPWAA